MNYRLYIGRVTLSVAIVASALVGACAATSVHIPIRPEARKSPFTLISVVRKALTNSILAAADNTATKGGVASDKKTLSFSQRIVRLVVHTGPENDMLSYRVNGLRNPTISVPHGATLKVLFVNNDGDMFHNIRFGGKPRAFENTTGSLLKDSVGTAPLAHVDGKTVHGAEIVIKVPAHAGKYAYFCTVRGHANGGMWGIIQVR